MVPHNPDAWSTLGLFCDALYLFDEADRAFQKAAGMVRTDHQKSNLYICWACMLVNAGRWAEAESMARRSVKYSGSPKARANLGLACLAQRNWREGWPHYDAVIGFDQSRKKVQYRGEPEWDGTPGKSIIIYGEQGLGDEIAFGSMIPDAIEMCSKVVIDCDPKLAGLYRRSFPKATVYGTRDGPGKGWAKEDRHPDASISVGGLGKFLRLDDEQFHKAPYLTPDPDRVEMWRGLFRSFGRPVFGIAWSGGVAWTGDRFRRVTLEELLPLFRSVPKAVWVSLQYQDASREITAFRNEHPEIDLRQYAYATLTQDYDDTAALVYALDQTIGPPTSVIHLASAMWAPCIAMKAPISCWKFTNGLFLPNVKMIEHKGGWAGTIAATAEVLRSYYLGPKA